MDENAVKSGTQTTEFWALICALMFATLLLWSGKIPGEAYLDYTKWLLAGYAASRGLAKMGGKR